MKSAEGTAIDINFINAPTVQVYILISSSYGAY
jgi:hypothetical protein